MITLVFYNILFKSQIKSFKISKNFLIIVDTFKSFTQSTVLLHLLIGINIFFAEDYPTTLAIFGVISPNKGFSITIPIGPIMISASLHQRLLDFLL